MFRCKLSGKTEHINTTCAYTPLLAASRSKTNLLKAHQWIFSVLLISTPSVWTSLGPALFRRQRNADIVLETNATKKRVSATKFWTPSGDTCPINQSQLHWVQLTKAVVHKATAACSLASSSTKETKKVSKHDEHYSKLQLKLCKLKYYKTA